MSKHFKLTVTSMTNDPLTKREKRLIQDVFIYMMDYINDDCFTKTDRKHFDNVYSKLSNDLNNR